MHFILDIHCSDSSVWETFITEPVCLSFCLSVFPAVLVWWRRYFLNSLMEILWVWHKFPFGSVKKTTCGQLRCHSKETKFQSQLKLCRKCTGCASCPSCLYPVFHLLIAVSRWLSLCESVPHRQFWSFLVLILMLVNSDPVAFALVICFDMKKKNEYQYKHLPFPTRFLPRRAIKQSSAALSLNGHKFNLTNLWNNLE